MQTAIDRSGRILIPKKLRALAGWEAGTPLEATFEDGRIVLEPRATDVEIRRVGEFYVADAGEGHPVLRAEDVEREIANLRGGSGRGDS